MATRSEGRTSKRRWSDLDPELPCQRRVLGADSTWLQIGDSVLYGSEKEKGIIRFCGPTQFKDGIWVGVELESPSGKNDGSVNTVQYFDCLPKCGIFCRPAMLVSDKSNNPTSGMDGFREVAKRQPHEHWIGDRVLFDGHAGIVRFFGRTQFAKGEWLGIELDSSIGKNDGQVQGVSYFSCAPFHGIFCRPHRVQALKEQAKSFQAMKAFLDTPQNQPISVKSEKELTFEDLQRLWDLADIDGNGVLDREEFRLLVVAIRDDITEESIFATYDALIELCIAEGLLEPTWQQVHSKASQECGLDFDFFVEFLYTSEEGLQVDRPCIQNAISVLKTQAICDEHHRRCQATVCIQAAYKARRSRRSTIRWRTRLEARGYLSLLYREAAREREEVRSEASSSRSRCLMRLDFWNNKIIRRGCGSCSTCPSLSSRSTEEDEAATVAQPSSPSRAARKVQAFFRGYRVRSRDIKRTRRRQARAALASLYRRVSSRAASGEAALEARAILARLYRPHLQAPEKATLDMWRRLRHVQPQQFMQPSRCTRVNSIPEEIEFVVWSGPSSEASSLPLSPRFRGKGSPKMESTSEDGDDSSAASSLLTDEDYMDLRYRQEYWNPKYCTFHVEQWNGDSFVSRPQLRTGSVVITCVPIEAHGRWFGFGSVRAGTHGQVAQVLPDGSAYVNFRGHSGTYHVQTDQLQLISEAESF
mmetsp:Transcript_52311/g.137322  ORF Transcript_52311/g.137322 Transcript_52311/m.137322 type:complete len:701 (+) Transcript_52311:60-2162(+)